MSFKSSFYPPVTIRKLPLLKAKMPRSQSSWLLPRPALWQMVYMSRREACLSSGPLCSSSSASSPSPGRKTQVSALVSNHSQGSDTYREAPKGAQSQGHPWRRMAIKPPGFSFPALTFLISLFPYTLQLLAVGLGGILHLGDVSTIIKQEMAVDIFQLIH